MEPLVIATIVIVSVNLAISVFSPFIISGAFLIKNIIESDCWGAKMIIRERPINEHIETQTPHIQKTHHQHPHHR